jgi:hypothetical protein
VQVGVVAGPAGKVGVEDGKKSEPADGLWLNLSRDRVNDLIRILRRARGGAYGADA